MKKYCKGILFVFAVLAAGFFITAFTFDSTNQISGVDSNKFEPVSGQIWAVSVSADPGHEGSLSTSFTAAYDPEAKAGDNEETVGNYFNIEQEVSTTSGETRRYIDISSPESGAYLKEDMSVIGATEIKEAFTMENIPGISNGSRPDWFSLF